MKRRSKALPELPPVYVRPTFDRRELAAKRAWCCAAYSGKRHRPKRGEFDPLELRLGMRAQLIDARAGWVVSNPLYDQTLRTNPEFDPSLPGPGWLWQVYSWHKARGLVTLARTCSVIEQRLTAACAPEEFADTPTPPTAATTPAQQTLFSAEESS